MGDRTSLDADQAGGHRPEETQDIAARQLPALKHLAGRVGDMDVVHIFGQIEAHDGWGQGTAPCPLGQLYRLWKGPQVFSSLGERGLLVLVARLDPVQDIRQ